MANRFEADFKKYTDLILSEEHFAYARYADGEILLMQGLEVGYSTQAYSVDGWYSKNKLTKVGKELLKSLEHQESNYHYAISSHSDSSDHYSFLASRIQNKNITFANLWINSNYPKMKAFYESLPKSVYVICNHKAKKDSFPFAVSELFPFPEDCVNYWEENSDEYLQQLLDYTSQIYDKTFFVSAGPVSEILIDKMYQANPKNQYIDVGSSMDEYIFGRKTRPYMDPGSYYATQVSYFNE